MISGLICTPFTPEHTPEQWSQIKNRTPFTGALTILVIACGYELSPKIHAAD